MRFCHNKTSFSWSYRDLSKRLLENNVNSRMGKRKIHTLWDRWTCANGKEWSPGTKEVLVIRLHMVGNEFGSFNLEAMKFLMHFREPGSSLNLILFILTHFFFSFYSYIFFLFSFFLFLIFSHKNFYLLPLNSKIALYLPPPPCLDVCSSTGKEVIKIR
jgi:hypothetical protein